MRLLPLVGCCLFSGWSPLANAFMFCSEPSEPSVPSGYSADEYQMERARREIEDYLGEVEDFKNCLLDAAREADNAAESIVDEWNRAVRNYNNNG